MLLLLVPASALYSQHRIFSISIVVVAIAIGGTVFVLFSLRKIEIGPEAIVLRGAFRSSQYRLSDIRDVQAEIPKSDSERGVRSPFVVVYPYLMLTDSRRIRLTPAGSFARNPFTKSVNISETSAAREADAIRGKLGEKRPS